MRKLLHRMEKHNKLLDAYISNCTLKSLIRFKLCMHVHVARIYS